MALSKPMLELGGISLHRAETDSLQPDWGGSYLQNQDISLLKRNHIQKHEFGAIHLEKSELIKDLDGIYRQHQALGAAHSIQEDISAGHWNPEVNLRASVEIPSPQVHLENVPDGTYPRHEAFGAALCPSPTSKGFKSQSQEISYWETLGLEEAFALLEPEEAQLPSIETFLSFLHECHRRKDVACARHLHLLLCKNNLETHRVLGNYLVPVFVACGALVEAQQAFRRLTFWNEHSWTYLIKGYVEYGEFQHAFLLYSQMQEGSVHPSIYSLLALIKACARLKWIEKGREIHTQIVTEGSEGDQFVTNALLDMYARCGSISEAQAVFEKQPIRDVVSWNVLVTGYIEHNLVLEALYLLEQMQLENVTPTVVTLICSLKACGSIGAIDKGRETHTAITGEGLEADPYVANTLTDMYARFGFLTEAEEVFHELPVHNVVSWNVLIAGYSEQGYCDEAVDCLRHMRKEGVSPNAITFLSMLKACGCSGDIVRGYQVHIEILKEACERDQFVGNALVDMYAKCGLLMEAEKVFDELPMQDVISWNALLTGYTAYGYYEDTLSCIEEMLVLGVSVNAVTLVCGLKACGKLGEVERGQELHAIGSEALQRDLCVANALVDMYVKCGLLTKAQEAFDELLVRDVISWNTLISAYAEHGLGENVLQCFKQMQLDGVSPDVLTLACYMKGCSTIAAIDNGREIHQKITMEGLNEDHLLGSALVGMYAKFGALDEAEKVFDGLSVRDVVSWTALISGYADSGLEKEVLNCLELMQYEGVSPNEVTLVCSLKYFASIPDIDMVEHLFAEMVSKGMDLSLLAANTLVDVLMDCGLFAEAVNVFESLPVRNIVSWNTLVSGHIQRGCSEEALNKVKQMQLEGISPNSITLSYSLKACGTIGDIETGLEIHNEILYKGFEMDDLICNTLVDMYANCGSFAEAKDVFKCVAHDAIAWNVLVKGYTEYGLAEGALSCLKEMRFEGLSPDAVTFLCSLKACGSMKDDDKGRELHADLVKQGYDKGIVISNSLLDMYGKFGSFAEVLKVFIQHPSRDVVSWTAVMTGYVEYGHFEEALEWFQRMEQECVTPNAVTIVCSLKACIGVKGMDEGCAMHALIAKEGFERACTVGNTLVEFYGKCGLLTEAQEVFDELPVQDVTTWSALIAGYAEHGSFEEAFNCYKQMQFKGLSGTSAVYCCLLKACCLQSGQHIHGITVQQGLENDPVVANVVANMYGKFGSLGEAAHVLDKLQMRDAVSWNTLITGYAEQGLSEHALECLEHMQQESISPDAVTFVCSLQACSSSKEIEKGRELHAESCKTGFDVNVFVSAALMNMYVKCASLMEAQRVFECMPVQDEVLWNTLVRGYAEHGLEEEVSMSLERMELEGVPLDLVSWNAAISSLVDHGISSKVILYFNKMQEQGISPDSTTFLSILRACGNIASLETGKRVHAQIARACKADAIDVIMTTALLDMYGKCGNINAAQQLFDAMPNKDLFNWTALITAYAHQGEIDVVFQLLKQMCEENIQPNSITFLNILSACSHAGLINEGQKYFQAMTEVHGITPTNKHYHCMVDLLGRAGQVEAALLLVKQIPCQLDDITWNTVLGACQKWGDLRTGRQAFKHTLGFNEISDSSFILMSNIYVDACSLEDSNVHVPPPLTLVQ